jgi:hypothetical protein
VTRIFRSWSGKPLGRLLAEGIVAASARELANASNWRLRAAISALRGARLEAGVCKDDLRIGVMSEVPWYARRAMRERRKELAVRNLARWTYNVRELLKQRARLRRNRGLQMTLDEAFPWDRPGAPPAITPALAAEVSTALHSSAVDNPRHSSETFEHGTPPEVVDAARVVLGGAIDLDPASCEKANGYVRAVEFMTREDNGFFPSWWGASS